MDILQELYQREMIFRAISTIQDKHTYHLEEILFTRGTVPGNDHVKLKVGDTFVFSDLYGTYFQKSGAMTLYLDNVLEMDLSSYTKEQVEAMRKQNVLDRMYKKSYDALFQYYDEFTLFHRDKIVYPVGMYSKFDKVMIYSSYSPKRDQTDVFHDFSGIKAVPKIYE